MSLIINLSAQELRRAAKIKEQIQSLENEIGRIFGPPEKSVAPSPISKKRRTMSAAGRASVAAAQKARWAKVKAKVAPAKKPKRKMSAAAKAKISAAAKARWAKIKKGEKS
jgi:hypothetical protein